MIRLPALREGANRRLMAGEQKRVDAARNGSREDFDALVSDYQGEIRKFVQKRVPKDSADDLVQEIWLAAWTSMAEFDGRSRFKTWLYGIAINKCKTLYRSQQRRTVPLSLTEGVADRIESEPLRPGSDIEARLSEHVEALPDHHRQLLDLYYYGELTLPEISRLLDRNLNTVKYQFYRAHTELANMLKEDKSE